MTALGAAVAMGCVTCCQRTPCASALSRRTAASTNQGGRACHRHLGPCARSSLTHRADVRTLLVGIGDRGSA